MTNRKIQNLAGLLFILTFFLISGITAARYGDVQPSFAFQTSGDCTQMDTSVNGESVGLLTTNGDPVYICVDIQATITPTPTLTIEPTATIEPTLTPEPTATLPGYVVPYPLAPACLVHDDRAYHGLWNGVLGCHYDHHHGNDPRQLDGRFGTDLFDLAGGEISYPWQTFSVYGTENAMKHEGYIWIVREGLDYTPRGNTGQVVDFRVQVHQLADGHDANVRYHSFAAEFYVCPAESDPVQNGCGFARIMGWQDTGDLEVDRVVAIDEPNSFNRVKQHSSHGPVAVWYPASTQGIQGQQGFARISVTTHDQWDYTDPETPGDFTDYICYPAANCTFNGTTFRPHLIMIDIPAAYEAIVDPDGDGIADYEGYLNRYGAIVENCGSVSLDCIPFVLQNIRTDISYNYADLDPGQDYDVWFCNGVHCAWRTPGARTSGWMQPVQ